MSNTTARDHAVASACVRKWARQIKSVENLFSVKTDFTQGFTLAFPENPYFTVQVSFYRVEGRPDCMRVQSTNWRCEDEPNDIIDIDQARAMWRDLRLNCMEWRPF